MPEAARAEWIEFHDDALGHYRAAVVRDGQLLACLMVTAGVELPSRAWLASLFARDTPLDAADRRCLLLGRREHAPDPGPTVCACFGVGTQAIAAAVDAGCITPEAVGRSLKAGTNCGSCRPEIVRLITVR